MKAKIKEIPVWMSEFVNLCFDIVFPRRCPVCDEPVEVGKHICSQCREKVQYVGDVFCMKCGKPLKKEEYEYCVDCLGKNHAYDRGRSVFVYGSIASSVYRFKYKGRREYAAFYGDEIVKRLGHTIKGWKAEAIVPVPVHWSRQNQRGYNQALLLAKEVGKGMGIPVEQKLAKRVKKTKPQKLLGPEERQNNLKKAFIICENDVKLKTIILIDDIYTTGSTVDAIAELLKKHGIEHVYVISLAIGTGIV